MSVLIKGMEMPDHCIRCPFMISRDGDDCILQNEEANESFENWEQMKKNCPLVDVKTPHGDLIDRDATIKQWGLDKATKYGNETAEQQYFSYSTMMMYEIADILYDAPTVIEAEDEE